MTFKQRKFIRELKKTFSPTEAAMRSYNCKSRDVAKVIASQLLTKLNVQMNDLMDKMGLNIERDIEDLKNLREAKITKHFAYEGQIVDEAVCEDNATRLKALELTYKLKGLLKEKHEHSGTGFGNTTVNVYPNKTIVFAGLDEIERIGNIQDVHATESEGGSRIEETV